MDGGTTPLVSGDRICLDRFPASGPLFLFPDAAVIESPVGCAVAAGAKADDVVQVGGVVGPVEVEGECVPFQPQQFAGDRQFEFLAGEAIVQPGDLHPGIGTAAISMEGCFVCILKLVRVEVIIA